MKASRITAFAAAVALASSLVLAQGHGGRVVETRQAIYELVANKDLVVIHVDLKGKKGYSTKGARASFEILNANGQVIDRAKLLPGDGSTLQARGPFKLGPNTKLIATITFSNNPSETLSWSFR